MKMILVPTDGSEAAEKALEVAIDLAKQNKATIKLMHVLLRDKEPHQILKLPDLADGAADLLAELEALEKGPALVPSVEDIMANPNAPSRPLPEALLRKIGDRVLDRAAKRVKERGVETFIVGLYDGPIAKGIVAKALEVGSDMIVMGMRGLSRVETVALGSVSQEVCRTTKCTLAAVH